MAITYTHARAHFAELCDQAVATREPVVIQRRGAADVALVAADELAGLLETAHLLRSPRNAARLMAALTRAQGASKAKAKPARPKTLDALKQEVGLGASR